MKIKKVLMVSVYILALLAVSLINNKAKAQDSNLQNTKDVKLKSTSSSGSKLTLAIFLQEVRMNNPESLALESNLMAVQRKVNEAEFQLSPFAYLEYSATDDQRQTTTPSFQGDQTKITNWRAGVKKQSTFGLSADVYLANTDVDVRGIDLTLLPPGFQPQTQFNESRAVVELRQNLWRNSFGSKVRNEVLAAHEATKSQYLLEKFKFQQFLLNAEATYWSLATLNQVIRLQEENIERAKKLKDLMKKRFQQKLVDEVDYLQAEVALQAREFEWQNLIDEKEVLARTFETLRGSSGQEFNFSMDELPTQEWLTRANEKREQSFRHRADFEAMKLGAKAGRAKSLASSSNIQPDLDVFASFSSNGRDPRFSESFNEIGTYDYPNWTVGLSVSVPLDLKLISDLKQAYKNESVANERKEQQAIYQEKRALEDVVQRLGEAQVRFERMVKLEKIQSQMVEKERERQSVGRSTTFQTIRFEQELAATQIQRVRAQLDLIQTHNQLKLFQESL